jgi:uncharacterized protein
MENKKTLVIGASPNPQRFSYKAIRLLQKYGHAVEAIGIRTGKIDDIEIQLNLPILAEIQTVTLYIGTDKQHRYYDYILNLHPQRIIFNPGTENPELEKKAKDAGIEVVEDCTLVMLNNGRF